MNIYEKQHEQIAGVIGKVKAETATPDEILNVIKIVLSRMEYTQKVKMKVSDLITIIEP